MQPINYRPSGLLSPSLFDPVSIPLLASFPPLLIKVAPPPCCVFNLVVVLILFMAKVFGQIFVFSPQLLTLSAPPRLTNHCSSDPPPTRDTVLFARTILLFPDESPKIMGSPDFFRVPPLS